jgi:tryptophan-rich sensory protein
MHWRQFKIKLTQKTKTNRIAMDRLQLTRWATGAVAVAVFAAQFPTPYDKKWFGTLKSRFLPIPPARVFQIVWPVLLSLTAISYIFLTFSRGQKQPLKRTRSQQQRHSQSSGVDKNLALIWLNVNLAFNFGWSVLFFKWHWKGAAVVDSVGCWVSLALAIKHAKRVHFGAFLLLLPYIAWLTFGTVLGVSIWLA